MSAQTQGFEASLFHPDLGNEVVHGRIFIERDRIRFVSGDFSEEIPAQQVKVTIEEGTGRVYFMDPSRSERQIFTPDSSVLEDPSAWRCEPVWSQVTGTLRRREFGHRLQLTAYFVGACILVVMVGSWVMGAMVRSVAKRVPPEWEQKFGEEELAKVQKKFHFIDDSNWVAQIANVAQPLIEVLPPENRNLKFYIVDMEQPNAFALPGGHVAVTTGLLDMVDRPEQLLGVLAHEMAHITQKHHVRKMISATGPLLVCQMFLHGRSGFMNVLTTGSAVLVLQGFSKEYETEADEVGWDYLVKANIDPRGMIEMFQKLRAYQSAKMPIRLPEAFESHPALDKRLANLERRAKKLPAAGFRQLEPVDVSGRKKL